MASIKLPEEYSYIDLNPEFELALDKIINTQDNLHIMGPAGVGKSTLIKIISDKRVLKGNTVVIAPTGIASVNASSHGVVASTIHHLFKLPPLTFYTKHNFHLKDELVEIICSIDNLVMDEGGMCNASLFDFMIQEMLHYRAKKEKSLPRMFIVADPFQLPPVIPNDDTTKKYFDTMYFGNVMYFNSFAFKDYDFKTIELNKIYRQADTSIQNILNRVRKGQQTDSDLEILNARVVDEGKFASQKDYFYIYLAVDNKTVNTVNQSFLEILEGSSKVYSAKIEGEFDLSLARQLQERIELKVGYQVMVTKNSEKGPQDYANGTLGKIISLHEDSVMIETKEGKPLRIPKGKFSQYSYSLKKKTENTTKSFHKPRYKLYSFNFIPNSKENKKNKFSSSLSYDEVGTFTQILVKGAHALTIHKTQGLTLDAIYFDLGKWVGIPSLVYVALSRSKTLEGIGLSRNLRHSDIKVNKEVLSFIDSLNKGNKSV